MTTLIIEDSAPQAKQLVDYVRELPFVKVESRQQSSGNAGAVQRALDAMPDGILAEITDPVNYQKTIRDEWN